jgi:hypothetical protein
VKTHENHPDSIQGMTSDKHILDYVMGYPNDGRDIKETGRHGKSCELEIPRTHF